MNSFPYHSDKEYLEIKNVDGVYLAYFKGEVLPAQMETEINQGAVNEFGNYETYATIKFLVKPEHKKQISFEIKGQDLNNVIMTAINKNNSK
jgi:hypothetical protein